MRLSIDKIAIEGDKVLFNRSYQSIIGEVVRVKEESVIVLIGEYDAELLNIATPLTVVAHKNYTIID